MQIPIYVMPTLPPFAAAFLPFIFLPFSLLPLTGNNVNVIRLLAPAALLPIPHNNRAYRSVSFASLIRVPINRPSTSYASCIELSFFSLSMNNIQFTKITPPSRRHQKHLKTDEFPFPLLSRQVLRAFDDENREIISSRTRRRGGNEGER